MAPPVAALLNICVRSLCGYEWWYPVLGVHSCMGLTFPNP